MAAFLKTRNETATRAIQGHAVRDLEKEERNVQRVVWNPNKDLNPATDDRGNPAKGTVNRSLTWTPIQKSRKKTRQRNNGL
jgi:hypothetical protein